MPDPVEPSDESLERPDPTVRFNMDRFRGLGFSEWDALLLAQRRVEFHAVARVIKNGCDEATAANIFCSRSLVRSW